MIPAIASR